jgi:xylan 1,4-beta-xylosidase
VVPGVRIYHSRDLKNWSLVSTPLDRVSMLDMKGNPDSGGIWAPCLSYADGKFWLLYTDVKIVDSPWKNGRNFLVTAPSIEGPWSEPIPMGNGGFDPSLFHDDDGRKYYLYRPWGPRHHSNPHNTIVMQAFDPQTGTLSPERKTVYRHAALLHRGRAPVSPRGMVLPDGGRRRHQLRARRRGAAFQKHRRAVRAAPGRDDDDQLAPAGEPAAEERPRLAAADPHRGVVMAYLTSRPLRLPGVPLLASGGRGYCPLGRETGIARIEWRDGWPYVEGGKHAQLTVKGPQMAEQPAAVQGATGGTISTAARLTRNCRPCAFRSTTPSARSPRARAIYGSTATTRSTRPLPSRPWRAAGSTSPSARDADAVLAGPLPAERGADLLLQQQKLELLLCGLRGGQGRTIKVIQLDHNVPSWPLHEQPIPVPEHAESVWLRWTWIRWSTATATRSTARRGTPCR